VETFLRVLGGGGGGGGGGGIMNGPLAGTLPHAKLVNDDDVRGVLPTLMLK